MGCESAFYFIGRCYELGIGTEPNPKKAFENYKLAARNNYRDAKYALGRCYAKGIGTKSQQALKLWQEQNKLERKTQSREQKEAEKARKFELKQQKKSEKHRGR